MKSRLLVTWFEMFFNVNESGISKSVSCFILFLLHHQFLKEVVNYCYFIWQDTHNWVTFQIHSEFIIQSNLTKSLFQEIPWITERCLDHWVLLLAFLLSVCTVSVQCKCEVNCLIVGADRVRKTNPPLNISTPINKR